MRGGVKVSETLLVFEKTAKTVATGRIVVPLFGLEIGMVGMILLLLQSYPDISKVTCLDVARAL
jgi:hypothetical protein